MDGYSGYSQREHMTHLSSFQGTERGGGGVIDGC
jgi:hypothetical protein